MITKEKLNNYAEKLMFRMNNEEYETLQKEFDILLKQMDLIGNIKDIENIEPMTFPFPLENVLMREDKDEETLTIEEVLKNAKDIENGQVKVPKVVE